MGVFKLRKNVISEYEEFATSFTNIRDPDILAQVKKLYAEGRYWPEPLLQINPNYLPAKTIENLVQIGVLDAGCRAIFRQSDGQSLMLYKHQEEAIMMASEGSSYVVTTGTGSGKSLCFFIPIVNAILAEKKEDPTPRTWAIIIYPMNALANSQFEELNKYVKEVNGRKPVTFARYTGQESAEQRQRIAENPRIFCSPTSWCSNCSWRAKRKRIGTSLGIVKGSVFWFWTNYTPTAGACGVVTWDAPPDFGAVRFQFDASQSTACVFNMRGPQITATPFNLIASNLPDPHSIRRRGNHLEQLHHAAFPDGLGHVDEPVADENRYCRAAVEILQSPEHAATL
jgi:hypothetical protein